MNTNLIFTPLVIITVAPPEYKAGAAFTGMIKKVVIDLAGERHIDPETEAKIVMKRQ